MGRQQLILMGIAMMIVGIAVLISIDALGEESSDSNWDSMTKEAFRIAHDAQHWKMKPEMFGGSPDHTKNKVTDYNHIHFAALGYKGDLVEGSRRQCYRTVHGLFRLDAGSDKLVIQGVNMEKENLITVNVTGVASGDVKLSNQPGTLVRGGKMTNNAEAYQWPQQIKDLCE